MRVTERLDDLRIGDNQAIHDGIRHQAPDEFPRIMNRKRPLLINRMAPFPQFNHQRPLIQFLIESRTELIEHSHRRADNLTTEFLVNHWSISPLIRVIRGEIERLSAHQ